MQKIIQGEPSKALWYGSLQGQVGWRKWGCFIHEFSCKCFRYHK